MRTSLTLRVSVKTDRVGSNALGFTIPPHTRLRSVSGNSWIPLGNDLPSAPWPLELTFPVMCDPVTLRQHRFSQDGKRPGTVLTRHCDSDVTALLREQHGVLPTVLIDPTFRGSGFADMEVSSR